MARLNAEEARKHLADCTPEKEFWVCDNRKLKNLNELATALKEMDDNVFAAHNNEEKKDFSNWVSNVLGDKKLAEEIAAPDKKKVLKAVVARVQQLNAAMQQKKPGQKARPKRRR